MNSFSSLSFFLSFFLLFHRSPVFRWRMRKKKECYVSPLSKNGYFFMWRRIQFSFFLWAAISRNWFYMHLSFGGGCMHACIRTYYFRAATALASYSFNMCRELIFFSSLSLTHLLQPFFFRKSKAKIIDCIFFSCASFWFIKKEKLSS